MFKRFSVEESVSGQSAMKSSQQRAARAKIIEQMPAIEPYIEDFFPKKEKTLNVKCAGHISILASAGGTPLFFQTREGTYIPTLRTLHKYPFLLPVLRVDRGAIKHVINGADIMVPGLKSARAVIQDEAEADKAVAIFAESKEHAIAVGLTRMSTNQIRQTDKAFVDFVALQELVMEHNRHELERNGWCEMCVWHGYLTQAWMCYEISPKAEETKALVRVP